MKRDKTRGWGCSADGLTVRARSGSGCAGLRDEESVCAGGTARTGLVSDYSGRRGGEVIGCSARVQTSLRLRSPQEGRSLAVAEQGRIVVSLSRNRRCKHCLGIIAAFIRSCFLQVPQMLQCSLRIARRAFRRKRSSQILAAC